MHGRMKKRPGPLAPPESECIFLRKICLRSFFQMLEEIFRKSVGQFSFLVQGTFLQATKAENHCSFILLHNLVIKNGDYHHHNGDDNNYDENDDNDDDEDENDDEDDDDDDDDDKDDDDDDLDAVAEGEGKCDNNKDH